MPLDTAVYSTTHIFKEGCPIVWVSHELDGDWQFMGNQPIDDYRKVAMIVGLKEVIKLDRSVLEVADLPMGYCATRKSRRDKWVIAKIDYTDQEIKEFGFYCATCGLYHKEIPMAYGTEAPYQYSLIPENEREARCTLTRDQCVIDDRQHFIRGRVTLPVDDKDEPFLWNVWVHVSEEDFYRYSDLWEDENRVLEKPYPGTVATHLQPYPETLGLPVWLITQPVGSTPIIELPASDHPLHLEQESGITIDRVVQFARQLLYQH